MTDIEISKALALAIGWTENRIGTDDLPDPDVVIFHCSDADAGVVKCWDGNDWRIFDYRDWNVIGPIAVKFNAFPYHMNGYWESSMENGDYVGNTPQKAISFAVIGGAK